MAKHYHRLKPVKDYQDIDDVLFKFSLNLLTNRSRWLSITFILLSTAL